MAKSYFLDLEFLCDRDFVYEETIIALCLLSEDDAYELTSLVRPYEDVFEVSEYCTDLTGISKENLLDQPYFDELYDEILNKTDVEDIIYVWGDVDLEALYKFSLEITGELEIKIVDFQEEFMAYCGYKFRPGLKKVYQALTEDDQANHHDVKSDTLMLREIYRLFHEDKKATMRKVKGKIR